MWGEWGGWRGAQRAKCRAQGEGGSRGLGKGRTSGGPGAGEGCSGCGALVAAREVGAGCRELSRRIARCDCVARMSPMAWKLEDLERDLLIGSTLVEGSTLSEAEAAQVLRGRTVAGHSVREIRELINYQGAVGWLLEQLARSPYLSVDLIEGLHARLFAGLGDGGGRLKTHGNYSMRSDGKRHDYLPPKDVPSALQTWVAEYNRSTSSDSTRHHEAAHLYYVFQEIHPFEDGNGRIGRVLLAYWLHWKHAEGFSFHLTDKLAHLEALEAANDGDLEPLQRFFEACCAPEEG